MRKIYFGIIVIFLLVLSVFTRFIIKSYSKTGHDDFKDIIFVDEGKLLTDYSEEEIEKFYENLDRKMFGWSTYIVNDECYATFEGITLFSKSNKTTKAYPFEYVLKETETTQTSVTVKGNVSAKITGTIKKIITVAGSAEISGQWDTKNTIVSDAKTQINLNILPNRKISMLILGDCYITNGVSRYTMFYITFKSGVWERVDADVIYYEVREEKV